MLQLYKKINIFIGFKCVRPKVIKLGFAMNMAKPPKINLDSPVSCT